MTRILNIIPLLVIIVASFCCGRLLCPISDYTHYNSVDLSNLSSIDHNICEIRVIETGYICDADGKIIRTYDKSCYLGTGFFVGETNNEYLIMTAGHLTNHSHNNLYNIILFWDGSQSNYISAKFVSDKLYDNNNYDEGIISVPKKQIDKYGKPCILPIGNDEDYKKSKLSFTIGFPGLQTFHGDTIPDWPNLIPVVLGKYSATRLCHYPEMTNGRSGSPIYSSRLDKVLGMVTTNTYSIKYTELSKFLNDTKNTNLQ